MLSIETAINPTLSKHYGPSRKLNLFVCWPPLVSRPKTWQFLIPGKPVPQKTGEKGRPCRAWRWRTAAGGQDSNSRAAAVAGPHLSKGQTLYVPVYSNIYTSPKEITIHLANIVAIRNTDMHNQIQVTAADYYDTQGKLVKRYYQKPVVLAPLETIYLYLSERDQEGGFGANFIIRWQASREVNAPLIECLMVGSPGRAFVSPGLIIDETTR